MARKLQIVLNRDEIQKQLLKGEGTEAYLLEVAQRVADQSGLSCTVGTYAGRKRLNASVALEIGSEDYYRNLHTNALIAALH